MTEVQFNAAVEYVRSLPKDGPVQLSNDAKLEFYALFKQATEGPVTGSQPWAVQFEARAKWDARKAIENMSKEEAMQLYVKRLVEVTKELGHPWNPPQ
ncbi:Acyl-CoA-binding protein-like protein 3 [Trypanosoma grayi]|uniref:Acyl-CoA-binding protein-like protein 3 n=1 Tax=Trypanosoma grayi TaxID=71804 RepID=UPI0004F43737|nr:Acyl-CoA-binding protein-like protein 3 [Trypanosoma grayi]KEG05475.1 Acyl-CoA-binding protein-like protein 3 [Trypanosoma grayi]